MKKTIFTILTLCSLISFSSCLKEDMIQGKCLIVEDKDVKLYGRTYHYYLAVSRGWQPIWVEVDYQTYFNARYKEKVCF